MLRKIMDSDLVGRTIQSVQNDSVNVVRLIFTDGSVAELWAEDIVFTANGNIPGILLEDNPEQEG